MPKSKKAEEKAEGEGVDVPTSVQVKPKKAHPRPEKSKNLSLFLNDVLPSLKKEMTRKKKEVFDLSAWSDYFKDGSKYIATYILPLFRFLEKNQIQCVRYGAWDNRHMVKTKAGFDRVMYLSKNADPMVFNNEMQLYCTQKYGKEWFKIPAKDGFRAKAASAAGYQGEFVIHLVGVYTDSYIDKEGKEIFTINPSLSFEPARAPIVRAPRPKKVASVATSPPECGQPEEDPPTVLREEESSEEEEQSQASDPEV